MALFLYKPHVARPDGKIASPDVIIDRVFVDREVRQVDRLSSNLWQQTGSDETSRAAYALVALGGGALVCPVLATDSSTMVVCRKAWRLNSFADHADEVRLNGVSLEEFGSPKDLVEMVGGARTLYSEGKWRFARLAATRD